MFSLNEDLLRATRRFDASGRPVAQEWAQAVAWRQVEPAVADVPMNGFRVRVLAWAQGLVSRPARAS